MGCWMSLFEGGIYCDKSLCVGYCIWFGACLGVMGYICSEVYGEIQEGNMMDVLHPAF